MRAVVVALTDLGRSARMQYHAQALAANGVDVDLVGYEGTPLPKRVLEDPHLTVHRFAPSTSRYSRGSFVSYTVRAIVDALRLSSRLWGVLRQVNGAELV